MSRTDTKEALKQQIMQAAFDAKARNEAEIASLTDSVSLLEYASLMREGEHGQIWTEALQAALDAHEIVVIPASEEIYWIDSTVIIPSNRRIEASGATIRLVPEYPYIMLRNEHLGDGTYAPIDTSVRDRNISIHGGSWEESCTVRGKRRLHASTDSFFGVQTCMMFNNLDHLTITDVTFSHATSFCVQVGDLCDGVFENFFFISCYADGLHINGNSKNLLVRNFSGHVGDDLVALNMYDWLGSSINYGPAKNVFCEDIHSASDSHAKAMRLQPGIFIYQDGTQVDCSLEDMYFRNLSGIFEYKLYFQSPPYRIGATPEGGGAGSGNNLLFENCEILAQRPQYRVDDTVKGDFGMFFINSNIGYLSLENIHYTVPEGTGKDTHLVAVGPMTWRPIARPHLEVFDPYISGVLDTLEMENIFVNGEKVTDAKSVIKIIEFDDVNKDGFSSGKGTLRHVFLDGEQVW